MMRKGIGKRVIENLGREITIVNKTRDSDEPDDWGDYDHQGSTLAVKGVVDRSGARHSPDPSGAIPQDQANFYIKEDVLVRDGGGSLPASHVFVDDQRYEVQGIDPLNTGVQVLTGMRG